MSFISNTVLNKIGSLAQAGSFAPNNSATFTAQKMMPANPRPSIPPPQGNVPIPQMQPASQRTQQSLQSIANAYSQNLAGRQQAMQQGMANQRQAEGYANQLVNYNSQLQDYANRQIESRQKNAEKMFAGLMQNYQKDPMFGYMRNNIMRWMQNPGLSPQTMARLQGQAQARAAADLASRQGNIDRSAAQLGLSGASVEDARWAARSRSNSGLNRALLDIDLRDQDMRQQGRAGSIAAAGNLMSQYYGNLRGMGGAYADLMGSYNPQVAPLNVYDAMQSVYANPYYGTQAPQVNPYAGLIGNPYSPVMQGIERM